ncbi:sugar ABC transporter permease [Microbacterium keratanolyticum]|uniref:sugar ABC transporter permease n=1 Tax=Microbacterium keratanolyticum TaxID=67574 RepID=UPI00363A1725
MTLSALWQQFRDGERPIAPVLVALAVVWLALGAAAPTFWSPENLVNLALQSVSTGIIALGIVVVLLVGQIDLSVGSVSGLAAATVAVGVMQWEWPLTLAVLVALAAGALTGLIYGVLVAYVGLPGFVLTLSGLLVIAGIQWQLLGRAGSVNLPLDSWLVRFSQTAFVPAWLVWTAIGLVVVATATARLIARRRRIARDLPVAPLGMDVLRVVLLAAVFAVPALYLHQDRGIGWSVALFIALVAAVGLLLRRTRWGRSIRAVGGDTQAARLAGVPIRPVVLSAFVVCSTLAALGGVLAAGRLAAANQDTGGGELFLMAIAAAVVGGTSLYGGRGSAWSALAGVLVIQSIANGLTLLDLDASARNIATGVVLVVAISVDTLLRRRSPQR